MDDEARLQRFESRMNPCAQCDGTGKSTIRARSLDDMREAKRNRHKLRQVSCIWCAGSGVYDEDRVRAVAANIAEVLSAARR